MLTNFATPELTLIGTAFVPLGEIGCAFAELVDEPPPPEPPDEPPLELELLSSPPQAASTAEIKSTPSQRARPHAAKRWREGRVSFYAYWVGSPVAYWISLADTPAGKDCGRYARPVNEPMCPPDSTTSPESCTLTGPRPPRAARCAFSPC